MLRPLALTALILTLAACASEGPRGRHGPDGERVGGPDGRGGPPRVRLFISPSGEPFRGANGRAAWFAHADADHDGAVTEAEFAADAMAFFKALDKNGDGRLDGFEIQAYEHDIVPEIGTVDLLEPLAEGGPRRQGGGMGRRGGRGGGRGGPAGGQTQQGPDGSPVHGPGVGREGAARFSLLNEPEPVANADENVDGQVSLAEWKKATARRFARLDKLHAGKLILSDLLLPPGVKTPAQPPPPAQPR